MKNQKHLLITLTVQDGERQHQHRVLHTTSCDSIEFAAQMYAAKFWGEPFGHDGVWWDCGDIMIRLDKVKRLSNELYDDLTKLFYY